MGEDALFDTLRQGLWVGVAIAAPILTAALVAGVAVGLFQALTSVQEMTLTFVPKIIAIFGILVFTMPFMYGTLTRLSDTVFDLIVSGGF